MVKTILSTYHQGLRDWIVQRVSAILIALYSMGLVVYLLGHPGLSFAEWHFLFSHNWMKVATLLFVVALLAHAWLGMWTIFTDYVKCTVVRGILNVSMALMLAGFFFWALLILWSV